MSAPDQHVPTILDIAFCPNQDHDGVAVIATRWIVADPRGEAVGEHVEMVRCVYCAEGQVARLLSAGYRVTIEPFQLDVADPDDAPA